MGNISSWLFGTQTRQEVIQQIKRRVDKNTLDMYTIYELKNMHEHLLSKRGTRLRKQQLITNIKGYFNPQEICTTLPNQVNPRFKDLTQCPTCWEDKDLQWSALVPCGHLFCSTCVHRLDKCPLCEDRPTKRLRLYVS